MLSENQMVSLKNAIASTFIGSCCIIESHKAVNQDKSTGFHEVMVAENVPCKLSFKNITKANQQNGAVSITQISKIFLSGDVKVLSGSKVIVTQYGLTTIYKSSGKPAFYGAHQEVMLELFEGWA